MKRRQTVRRIEIIAILAVVIVSLSVGFYLALNSGDPRSVVDGKLVSPTDFANLHAAAVAAYGESGSQYLPDVHNLTATGWSLVKPIVVYAGAEYCPFCAVQRYSIILALMRFGNFTDLHYMTSALGDGDYSTFTFYNSTYHSNYISFQPYELEDRSYNTLQTLPSNYTTAFDQQGKGDFPFLNFNDQYYISGAILDPSVLGSMNQTQVISAILAGNTVGSEIRQAANVITAVICETTGNKPTSVCNNASITALTMVSYISPSAGSGSELFLTSSVFLRLPIASGAGKDYLGMN